MKIVQLKDVARQINSGISRPFFSDSIGIPVLRSNNVRDGKVNTADLKYWFEKDPRGANLELVKPFPGDLLVNFVNGSSSELGKAGLFQGELKECIVSTNFFIVRLDTKKAIPEFLNYFFQSSQYKKWLYEKAGFTGQGSFNKTEFEKLAFPLPDLDQQKLIICVLSCYDSAIERTERLIAAKIIRKQSLMLELFFGSDPRHEKPAGWNEYHLGELFAERVEIGRTDLPLLSITQAEGVIPRDDTGRKDTSSEDKSKYLRICPGDIGYNTMRMWQGVSALSSLEGIVSPAYTICVPNDLIDGSYAAQLFKYQPIVNLFYRYSQGLTSDTWNLKFDNFAEIKIRLPEIGRQKKAARLLAAADDEARLLESYRAALQSEKSFLMSKLLSGEWEAPASAFEEVAE